MSAIPHSAETIESVVQFIGRYYEDEVAAFIQKYPSEKRVMEVDYANLRRNLPDVATDYHQDPGTIRELLLEALKRYDKPFPINDWSHAQVEVTGFGDILDHQIKDVGRFLPSELNLRHELFRGQVTKRSKPQPKAKAIIYECQRCGTETKIPQYEHDKQEPHDCSGCERQGPFRALDEESLKHAVDHQLIRIQEPPELASGGDSANLDVALEDHLVNRVEPGDRVVVGSEVDAVVEEDKPLFELKARAHSVDRMESDFESIDVEEYREDVLEIANGDDPHQALEDSIAPSHYGDEELKMAIAYSLFGGRRKQKDGGKKVRGSVHIFMVGDPGCGKSEMLQFVNEISPRSVYTSGAGSTAAGLTCAAMKDDFGDGGWTLEAGALVEANDGVACVDELDDMDEEDRDGFLEAMSEQTISVSKAGINATLPARTTVIAAANPMHGRYDTFEPIAEQIDVHPALISRFDMIFTMQDEPNEERDANIADRQLTDPDEISPEIDADTLRAYVAMGRELEPELTEAARDRIKQEYVGFRQINDEDGAIPITPRMVESMIRISEASARIHLSEKATVEDVDRALSVYKSWLGDVGVDHETGDFDADVIETGQSKSQQDRIKAITEHVELLEPEYEKGAPYDVVVEAVEGKGHPEDKVEHDIEQLKKKGELYENYTDYLRRTDS